MTGTSGPTSPAPLAFFDPATRSLRTSQGTFPSVSTPSSPTLPPSGSMRAGAVYAHRTSARPTDGTGSSSSPGLPTPRARDAKGRGFPDGLPAVASLLPTPSTSEAAGPGHAAQGGMNLRHVVSLLPTPVVGDSKGARQATAPNPRSSSPTLSDLSFAQLLPTPRATDGSKGGPNQRGSKGDLTLPSAAHRIGAPTPPPSTGGKASSDAPLPGQLTLWDA